MGYVRMCACVRVHLCGVFGVCVCVCGVCECGLCARVCRAGRRDQTREGDAESGPVGTGGGRGVCTGPWEDRLPHQLSLWFPSWSLFPTGGVSVCGAEDSRTRGQSPSHIHFPPPFLGPCRREGASKVSRWPRCALEGEAGGLRTPPCPQGHTHGQACAPGTAPWDGASGAACPAWPRSPSRPVGVQRGPLSGVLGLAVTAVWDGHTVDVPPSPDGSAPLPTLTDFPFTAECVRSGPRRSVVSLLWDVVAFSQESGVERLLWAAGHQGLGSQQTPGTGPCRPCLSSTAGCCGHDDAVCCCCCRCCCGRSWTITWLLFPQWPLLLHLSASL